MTLQDLEKKAGEILYPADVAPFLEVDAQSVRDQAQSDPGKLGFAVSVVGTRVKIPKQAFLHFMRFGYATPNKQ